MVSLDKAKTLISQTENMPQAKKKIGSSLKPVAWWL